MAVELRSHRPGPRWLGLKNPSRLPPVFHVGGAVNGDTGTGVEQLISVSFPDHHGIVNINLSCKADLAEHEAAQQRSEEHTSELQSRENLVCRLLLEKNKKSYTIKT